MFSALPLSPDEKEVSKDVLGSSTQARLACGGNPEAGGPEGVSGRGELEQSRSENLGLETWYLNPLAATDRTRCFLGGWAGEHSGVERDVDAFLSPEKLNTPVKDKTCVSSVCSLHGRCPTSAECGRGLQALGLVPADTLIHLPR